MLGYTVATRTKVVKKVKIVTVGIVCLICIATLLTIVSHNISRLNKNSEIALRLSLTTASLFELITMIAILFLAYRLNKINSDTIKLAIELEAIALQSSSHGSRMSVPELTPANENPTDVMFTVIPRKITLFRCIMEKKLGIDWEHEL